jgi:hypothetical protein
VRYWDLARGQKARGVAFACYFGWLAAFETMYLKIDESSNFYLTYVEGFLGLPTFVAGSALVGSIVWSVWPEVTSSTIV